MTSLTTAAFLSSSVRFHRSARREFLHFSSATFVLSRNRAEGCRRARSGDKGGILELKTAAKAKEEEEEEEDAFAIDGSGIDLEAELYEFMLQSPCPGNFPTREQLLAAGRADLAEAVVNHGGWLAFGWDLDDDDRKKTTATDAEVLSSATVRDNRMSQERVLFDSGSSAVASSSGRTLEMENLGEEVGIEGILSRLERERSLALDVGSKEKGASGREPWISADHDPGDAG